MPTDNETIKKEIVEKITDYMCEVAQKHYEFNDITFEEMSDLMEKELATKLNEIREEAVMEMAEQYLDDLTTKEGK